jgi:hypothetical protein
LGDLDLKKFNIGILGIMGILILVVFASGCVSSSNNTTNSSSSSSSQSGQSASSTGNPVIKISASGAWTGNIADSAGSKSVDGSGYQTIPLPLNPGSVAVTFQKDNSKDVIVNGTIKPDTSTLTVQLVDKDGNIVATQSTSADAGVVSVSHTF